MKKLFLLSAVILYFFTAAEQNNVSLELKLEKNKVYRFTSLSEQSIIQTINGNQQTIESKVNYAFSMKMIDVAPEFMITEVRFDTIITNTNTMGKTISMSSVKEGDIKSSETSEVMSCIMNRLSKNSLYVKMDFTGKVLEIVNSKMLADIVMNDTSAITLSGPVAIGIKTQIASMVSDKTLKTMVEMFTMHLPGKQVSAGDNWSTTVNTNSGGMSLDIITDYHLNGINGSNADISAESKIKASPNAEPMNSGGAKITYDDLSGLSKSTLLIDTKTGLLIEDKGKSHITGNLGLTMPGMSMQIPMEITSTSKVSILK